MLVFPTITIKEKTPYLRGLSYGNQAGFLISLCIDTYKGKLARAGVSWKIAQEVAMRHLSWVEKEESMPDMAEEVRGIAEGSAHDISDIAVINTRYELLHFPKECTSFVLQRSATDVGHIIVGQNWDQDPVIGAHAVLLDITEEETGNRIFGIAEAGQLIRSGMCAHGDGSVSAICGSSLYSSLDHVGIGCPTTILRRKALTLGRMENIINMVTGSARSLASSICIGTSYDEAVALELLPDDGDNNKRLIPVDPFYIIYPTRGIVTHDNSIFSAPQVDLYRHGHPRATHLKILFSEEEGNINLNYIKRCLSDHEGFPGSICSHGNDEDENWQTIASVIYDLDDRKAYVCCGTPCENKFMEFTI